ncbi:MAG: Amuc_1100 family pilus-like protein [Kiritimatiellia bacterium]|nr:Amuc_1100 family pilus-like protein [Kiritimatiellia bacterium]
MKTKSVVVIALVSVLVLVFAISSFLLARGIGQFSKEEKKLDRSVNTLRNYYGRNPFPSSDNVVREEANEKALLGWMANIADALREGQVEPIRKTPVQFRRQFIQARDQLVQVASQNKTLLPEGFAFGFERYSSDGTLPAPLDVPRLVQQLIIADQLCRVIFESGASELLTLRREEFESAGDVRTGAGGTHKRPGRPGRPRRTTAPTSGARTWRVSPNAGVLKSKDLHARLRFGLSFKAREEAVGKIMNALAAHEMFAVVTVLEIKKTEDDVTPPVKAAGGTDDALAGGVTEHLPRTERLMSGAMLEKPMQVTMEVDVYRFADLTSGRGA